MASRRSIAPPIPFPRLALTFEHISYTIKVKRENKVLIDDVSGYIEPSTLVALMGMSGGSF